MSKTIQISNKHKSKNNHRQLDADETGVMFIEILDPNIDNILNGLFKILPPMNNIQGITVLNNLKISSDIIKVSKKFLPENRHLWVSCYSHFFNSKYNKQDKVILAAKMYKNNGGNWIEKVGA